MRYLLIGVQFVVILLAGTVRQASAYDIFIDHSLSNVYDGGIPFWLTSLGHSVTVVSDYGGEDLSRYEVVMDFDFDDWHALTIQEKRAYTNFLNAGGGLYLQGERPMDAYRYRDSSVLAYLSELGSGTIGVTWGGLYQDPNDPYEYVVPSPVTQDMTLRWRLDASLNITNPGNGFFIVHTKYFNSSNLIGFEHGQLLNVPAGRLIASFDITTLKPEFGWDTNQYLFREMVDYLGASRSVTVMQPVPEPSTLVFLVVGSALLLRRKRQSAHTRRSHIANLMAADARSSE